MPDFTISPGANVSDAEVLALYLSVGWTAYTRDPQLLMRAIRSSSFLVAARDTGGRLIGIARTVSNDATIC